MDSEEFDPILTHLDPIEKPNPKKESPPQRVGSKRRSVMNRRAYHVIDKYSQKKAAKPKLIKKRIISQYKSIDDFERFHHKRVMSAIDDRFVLHCTNKYVSNKSDQTKGFNVILKERTERFKELDSELKNVVKMPHNKIVNRGGKLAILISPSVVEQVTRISQSVLKKNVKIFKSQSAANLTLKDGYLKLGRLNCNNNFRKNTEREEKLKNTPASYSSSILGKMIRNKIEKKAAKHQHKKTSRRSIKPKRGTRDFLLSSKMAKITKYLEKYTTTKEKEQV
ncbi:unnamed protein product [Moneuplotes crassus]|uniref:Uncharacterized protein n=1 Tax=Euplotes crassus TaxID=5936 RepID=A0AAD2D119_EUPCR|nr:unnamed protein product [Moneuplotes crassus]